MAGNVKTVPNGTTLFTTFEVMGVKSENTNIWVIRGLTYDTIAVGDRLYVIEDLEATDLDGLSVEVLQIVVFEDRVISDVDKGYYCNLSVVGEIGGKLSEGDYLYSI